MDDLAQTPDIAGRVRLYDVDEKSAHWNADLARTLIEAGFAGDLDIGFQAFWNDPQVTLDPTVVRDLFANMVAAERPYLEAYDPADAAVLEDTTLWS
jgi:alpha-galactosidase/6-phospho-beta-glucosidase family protein